MPGWNAMREELLEAVWLISVVGSLSVVGVLAAAGLALLT